jgi:undecaprenyl-diphosphatase
LHAASFTVLACVSFPELAWLCVPFAALVAASRVVLGLHYPTDVLAGAGIGAGLAVASIKLLPL